MKTASQIALATLGLLAWSLAASAEPDAEYVVELAAGDSAVRVGFRLPSRREEWSRIVVNLDNRRDIAIPLRVEAQNCQLKSKVDGKETTKELDMPDAVIHFQGVVQRYVRPRLQRYTDPQQQELVAKWGTLPAATEHLILFEARQEPDAIALYVDGQYVGRRVTEGRLRAVTVRLPYREGQELELEQKLEVEESFRPAGDARFLPLDVGAIARPGAMKTAELSVKPGLQTIAGIPLAAVGGAQSVDVGVVRQMKGSWALECDEHLSRTALDGMPESAHFAVPQAPYTRAWVLCAVANDPARDPILTARLTRFARSGRGGAISDTTIVLPRGETPPGPGVARVGTVRLPADGGDSEVPLYLAEFALKPGEILDLLSMDSDPNASMMTQPYLDFELLGKLGGIGAQWDSRHKPDNRSTSAVHVFGVTLERSPAGLVLACGQPGNIYHDGELPEMTAILTAWRPAKVALAWRIEDIRGQVRREGRQAAEFARAGESLAVPVELAMPELGWYAIEFTVSDEEDRQTDAGGTTTGRETIRHRAALALLGPNTRQAGYESPYGTWWFSGAHYGAADKAVAGPMLFKAGLRRTTFGWTKYTEADMAEWSITQNQIGWRTAPRDRQNPEAAYAAAEEAVREQLARFPHCRAASICHESFAHYVPDDLRGEPQVDSPEDEAKGRELVAAATFAARFYRERFPEIKLLVGNTSSSASIIAALLRYGFDPAYIDYLGIEAVGQTCMPEKLWEGGTQGIWLTRETARKFGHDLPVTGCYEFTARSERTLGGARHAEWIARDMLLCHAYRFDHINPAILHDAGNAYYNTLWGAGGLCQRYPLLYPKPAYVGVATLTRVLDRVKPKRRVETGSMTVYALEFERADGKLVTALWTAGGEARLRLSFPQPAAVTRIGFYGQGEELPAAAQVEIETGTAPVYAVSPVPVVSIEIVGRQFPPPPADFAVANRLDRKAEWELAEDASLDNGKARGLPIRVPGRFDLAEIDDAERGGCLQLSLVREGSLPDIVSEYAVLRLKTPLAVPGRPATVGLWVKGDSGWGKIIFEIRDATGTQWRTEGFYHDWPGELSIAHDGWRFIGFPIDGASTALNLTPGRRWNPLPPARQSAIEFPIELVGLDVVLNRKALDLTDMREVAGVVRLRDLGTAGAPAPTE